jgi:hypothetical protein
MSVEVGTGEGVRAAAGFMMFAGNRLAVGVGWLASATGCGFTLQAQSKSIWSSSAIFNPECRNMFPKRELFIYL